MIGVKMPVSGLPAKNLTVRASKSLPGSSRPNRVTFHGILSRSSRKSGVGSPGSAGRAKPPTKKGVPSSGRPSKKPVESKTRRFLRKAHLKRRPGADNHAGPSSLTGQFNRPAKGHMPLKRSPTALAFKPGVSVHLKATRAQGPKPNLVGGSRPQVATSELSATAPKSTRLVSKVAVQGKIKGSKPGLTQSQSAPGNVGLAGKVKASLVLRKVPVNTVPAVKRGLARLNGSASLKAKSGTTLRVLVHGKSAPKDRTKAPPIATKSPPEGSSWGDSLPAVPRGNVKGAMTIARTTQSQSGPGETSGTGPQGWTIEPAQTRNAGGIQESTWTIRPPLFMGPPMKMALIQEGSRLQANLTVHENLMGLVNTSPTALPQNAVHLPEGVSTLHFTLASHGGLSHGGELSQGFRQSQEGGHTPGAYGTADRLAAVASIRGEGGDGASLTMLDYRA